MKCPSCGKNTVKIISYFRSVIQIIQDQCPFCKETLTSAKEINRAEEIFDIVTTEHMKILEKKAKRQKAISNRIKQK